MTTINMTLLSREIEIYDFSLGARHWRYTTTARSAVVEGQTYEAVRGLQRTSRLIQSPEENRNGIEITAPLTLSVLDVWRPFPPLARVHLQVRRVRVSDGLVRNAWSGIVSDVEEDTNTATIRAQTLMSAAGANGLRRNWQVPCPLPLYSRTCGVSEDAFRTDAVSTFSAGTILRAAAFAAKPDGWFDGGFVRWPSNGDVDLRFVLSHIGDTLTLLTPADVPVGTLVATFPGCNHTIATCNAKFNNAVNYGGQHTIPRKNPFDGDPVF
jgi:uncharacterized phage protein (TIGR02218 family)